MRPPIGCAEALHQLWEYLDGALAPPDREVLEAHLAWCVRCCGETAFAGELLHLLRASTEDRMPADVQDRLERFVDDLHPLGDHDDGPWEVATP